MLVVFKSSLFIDLKTNETIQDSKAAGVCINFLIFEKQIRVLCIYMFFYILCVYNLYYMSIDFNNNSLSIVMI